MTDISTTSEQTAEQRTAAWHLERAGKFTGSKFADVLARNKKTGEPLKAYHDLIWQVVVERLTGQAVEGPMGFALQWGTDVEPFAREAYELATGNIVAETGFTVHPEFAFAGASPDGLIGDDGLLEMKCPKSSLVHLQRFVDGLPDEYRPQVQGQLWVTGRSWADFVSYDPRMPESHRLLRIRVNRDDVYISTLQAAVVEAEAAACALLERVKRIAA
jgi:putative phage-type endonuclease